MVNLFGRRGKLKVFEKGMTKGITEEPSLKVLYIFLIVFLAISFRYEANFYKRLWLILAILLIFCSEIINTSIEAVVDRIGLKYNVLSGYAKDLASSVTILMVLFGIYVYGHWFYNKWKESDIPIEQRNDKSINIFEDNKALFFIIIVAILAIPFAFFFRIFFKVSYKLARYMD